jgi:hypothetical protein
VGVAIGGTTVSDIAGRREEEGGEGIGIGRYDASAVRILSSVERVSCACSTFRASELCLKKLSSGRLEGPWSNPTPALEDAMEADAAKDEVWKFLRPILELEGEASTEVLPVLLGHRSRDVCVDEQLQLHAKLERMRCCRPS